MILNIVTAAAVLSACGCTVSGFGTNFWKFRELLDRHERIEGFKRWKQKLYTTPNFMINGNPEDQYFTQPLDHFDPQLKATYKQRYWVNPRYWRKPDGPVFLYIGGEGGLYSLVVEEGHYVELAEKVGALIVAVEHRYYGESINNDGLKLENLQYLSSQQALADLATFHAYISEQYGLDPDRNKWICFGGSYPGSLSAWFRLKYPHLVFGAVASSAPVEAKVDFKEYQQVVKNSLRDPIVNGSEKSAFQTVDAMLDNGQFAELAVDFRTCKPFSSTDEINQFVSNIADLFDGTVQYNNLNPGNSVTSLCEKMILGPGSPYQRLQGLIKDFVNSTGDKCLEVSYENYISQLENVTVDRGVGGVGIRQWIYQTCTQFGYYQTCEEDCIFSKYMTLGPNLKICQQMFNIDANATYQQVHFTNDYYGSNQPRGTRIIFVNGSVDPWHVMSVLETMGEEIAIFIHGTAHCANMKPSQESDPEYLKEAREKIDMIVKEWLNSDKKKDSTLRFQSVQTV